MNTSFSHTCRQQCRRDGKKTNVYTENYSIVTEKHVTMQICLNEPPDQIQDKVLNLNIKIIWK